MGNMVAVLGLLERGTWVDVVRIANIIGALIAIIVYARAAALFKNHAKGGLPAAYAPSNLALVVALGIVILDQLFRLGTNATWRAGAYFVLVFLVHWSLDRMGMTPWRRRPALGVSPETARVMRQVEALGEAVFAMDRDGVCIDVNGIGINLLGYGRSELIGANIHELAHYKHPDGTPMPAEECPLSQAMASGMAVLNVDTVLWDREGDPVYCVFSATPVVEDGTVIGGVVVFSEKVGT